MRSLEDLDDSATGVPVRGPVLDARYDAVALDSAAQVAVAYEDVGGAVVGNDEAVASAGDLEAPDSKVQVAWGGEAALTLPVKLALGDEALEERPKVGVVRAAHAERLSQLARLQGAVRLLTYVLQDLRRRDRARLSARAGRASPP
jgi:hypothetical protein